MAASPPLKLVFGSMTFGKPNTLGSRVHTPSEAGAIIDIFQAHNHSEIDTARIYGDGTTESILAEIDWQARGLVMGTKLYPNAGTPMGKNDSYTLAPADLRRGLMTSLDALGAEKVDLFYLHGPDRKTPLEDTLREVNNLYKEGRFNRFGISNFLSWEVSQICEICTRNNWILPSVYQGIYHALQRTIEAELLPCLRHYGIALYAFQPLAGGFLTGRYTRGQEEFEAGSRFDPKIFQGGLHRGRYWNESYFDALDVITSAAGKHGLSVAEVALRWLRHHSKLDAGNGDAVIVGASSTKHLEGNLGDLEKGPLPEDVVEALEKAWIITKAVAPKYWH
jgi:aflatoxin B1 aldehyde reductase